MHLKKWWDPILDMKFDDPEQDAPYWVATNNVVLRTPYPGIVIKAWSRKDGAGTGVFLSQNRTGALDAVSRFIRRDKKALAGELPAGTLIDRDDSVLALRNDGLVTDKEKYAWTRKNLNIFVNVLRPRLKKWHQALGA